MRLKNGDNPPEVRFPQKPQKRGNFRRVVRVVRNDFEAISPVKHILAAAHSGKFSERLHADFSVPDIGGGGECQNGIHDVETSGNGKRQRSRVEFSAELYDCFSVPRPQNPKCVIAARSDLKNGHFNR